MKSKFMLLVVATCFSMPSLLNAETKQAASQNKSTSVESTTSTESTATGQWGFSNELQSKEQRAKAWGLDTKDWDRYETIMQGPRGFWSPGLDPLTALGIEAKSSAERIRYARLQAVAEYRRAEAELAYQKAYDQAFKDLYPDSMLIGEAEPSFLKNQPPAGVLEKAPRTLFVSLNCTQCDTAVRKLASSNRSDRVDIYVVGTKGDDSAIRSWAAKVGIQPEQVRSRQITLNHNQEELGLITGKPTINPKNLPLAFKRVGNQWQKIDI